MICIYLGKLPNDLGNFRLQSLEKEIHTAKMFVHPQTIPPTAAATLQHS